MFCYWNMTVRYEGPNCQSTTKKKCHAPLESFILQSCAASNFISLENHETKEPVKTQFPIKNRLQNSLDWVHNLDRLNNKEKKMCSIIYIIFLYNFYLYKSKMYDQWKGTAKDGVGSVLSAVAHAVMSPIARNNKGLPHCLQFLQDWWLVLFPVEINGGK